MSYYITYSSLDQFVPATVHTADVHNTPHNRLLNNDVTLDTALYGVASRVTTLENVAPPTYVTPTLYSISPVLLYRANTFDMTYDLIYPPLYRYAVGGGPINTTLSLSYPGSIPVNARSIIIMCHGTVYGGSGGAGHGWIDLSSSLFPSKTVLHVNGGTNGDTNSNDVQVEMPYESSRAFSSYNYAIDVGQGSHAFFIFAVGYRT
jgi:hypothetical protein